MKHHESSFSYLIREKLWRFSIEILILSMKQRFDNFYVNNSLKYLPLNYEKLSQLSKI